MAQQQADALGSSPRSPFTRASILAPRRALQVVSPLRSAGADRCHPAQASPSSRKAAITFPRNVASPGLRRHPPGHAAPRRRARHRGRGADPDDPTCPSPPSSSGTTLPLPGLPWAPNPPPSHPPLGAGRSHHALESCAVMPTPPPRGPREGYQLERGKDGELRFGARRPRLPDLPPPAPVLCGLSGERAPHSKRGECPATRRTNYVHELVGEPLDLCMRFAVLHPQSAPPGRTLSPPA